MTDSKLLRIVVVNALVPAEGTDAAGIEQADRARMLRISLLEAGYNILAVFPPDADLQGHIAQLGPDVIIVDAQSDAAPKEVVSAAANAPRPIICFPEDGGRNRMHAALEAGVSAYIAAGLSAEWVKAVLDVAVARFEVDRKLGDELSVTRLKLAERKVIERAKGLLMDRRHCATGATVVPPALGIAFLVLIWEIVSASSSGIPTPLVTLEEAIRIFSNPFYSKSPNDQGIGSNLLASLERVAIGFGLAAAVGIPAGS